MKLVLPRLRQQWQLPKALLCGSKVRILALENLLALKHLLETISLFHQQKFICRATNSSRLDKILCPKGLLPKSGGITIVSNAGAIVVEFSYWRRN